MSNNQEKSLAILIIFRILSSLYYLPMQKWKWHTMAEAENDSLNLLSMTSSRVTLMIYKYNT